MLHQDPQTNEISLSGFHLEDRINVESAIEKLLASSTITGLTTLVLYNVGQREAPPRGHSYTPFKLSMSAGTKRSANNRCKVQLTEASPVIILLLVHEDKTAQQRFHRKNPMLFNSDNSYSKQVVSLAA